MKTEIKTTMVWKKKFFKRKPAWKKTWKRPYKRPMYRKKAVRRAKQNVDGQATLTKWLKYSDTVTIDAPSGGYSTYKYRTNNVWDPDVSSGGHQPMGFDNYMQFYQQCYVSKSFITVECVSQSSTVPSNLYILDGGLESNPITWGTNNNVYETNMRHSRVAIAGNWTFMGQGKTKIIPKLGWSAGKCFKGNMITEDGALCTATGGTVTARTGLYYIVAEFVAGLVSPEALTVRVNIQYKCTFLKPRQLDES